VRESVLVRSSSFVKYVFSRAPLLCEKLLQYPASGKGSGGNVTLVSIRGALGAIRWQAISFRGRRAFRSQDSEPTVSFTFDDFPRSALHVGGAILKSYGACGTYYAAMGLMDKVNRLGEHFSAGDLKQLLVDGHELGSHTFSHLSARAADVPDFDADVRK
jgi:peptidoglycan/xylan/chitin deacetylase (PgdA/CDA1 family)